MNNKSKWEIRTEYADNTGRYYWQSKIAVPVLDNPYGINLWWIGFFPDEKKLWFWNDSKNEESVTLFCDSWDDANVIHRMIENKKKHD